MKPSIKVVPVRNAIEHELCLSNVFQMTFQMYTSKNCYLKIAIFVNNQFTFLQDILPQWRTMVQLQWVPMVKREMEKLMVIP